MKTDQLRDESLLRKLIDKTSSVARQRRMAWMGSVTVMMRWRSLASGERRERMD